jgi:hypothetical protein
MAIEMAIEGGEQMFPYLAKLIAVAACPAIACAQFHE